MVGTENREARGFSRGSCHTVPSRSEAQVRHTVVFDAHGAGHCSCPSALFRRAACVHLAAAIWRAQDERAAQRRQLRVVERGA